MKKSQVSKLAAALLLTAYLFAGCDYDLPAGTKGPGPIDAGPGGINQEYEFTATEKFEYTFPASTLDDFTIEAVNGNVFVKQSLNSTEFKITGEKKAEAMTQADAEEALKKLEVVCESYGDELTVRTVQPAVSYESEYTVDYTIFVPAYTDLQLMLTNGHAVLHVIEGNVAAEIINGRISADVSMSDNGFINMTVKNGDINLNLPWTTSAKFSAKVGYGNISLNNVTLSEKQESENSLSGNMGSGEGDITLEVNNGDITVF
jgi:hypothetical protein